MLKGLPDAGLNPAAVDLVVGTSAAVTVGAQLAAEADPTHAIEILALMTERGSLAASVRAGSRGQGARRAHHQRRTAARVREDEARLHGLASDGPHRDPRSTRRPQLRRRSTVHRARR